MSHRSTVKRLSSALMVCLISLIFFPVVLRAGNNSDTSNPIYIVIWFDTEDFILPASDDAVLRLATILTNEGVKGTFKIVGEKARTLQRRGRQDVIAAIRQHDIGYHSNFHSVHPTPAERLSRAEWSEGIAEFDRTERSGFDDVQRIFGQPPICYGQPGSSWTVQTYAALKQWGVPLYLDESEHVGIHSQPFWYCGLLNVLKIQENVTRVELQEDADVEKAQTKFQEICQRLRAKGGGLVSIYYHPCEFVHQQFWDAVNFAHGMNPPREAWKQPAMKSAGEIEQAFKNFTTYISFLKKAPGARFVTGSELPGLYRDQARNRAFSRNDVLQLSQAVQKEITFWNGPSFCVSPAEIFSVLNSYLASFLGSQRLPPEVKLEFAYGPTRKVEGMAESLSTSWSEFGEACLDVQSALRKNQHIPNEIWMGSRAIPPADYLATLGAVVEDLIQSGKAREKLSLRSGNFTADQYVANDSPKIWGWLIFPKGFHAPKIMELAKLQAWTLKPAILSERRRTF